ncbi:MAG: MATE family efflux transporter [Enterobacteriaceae bacterium]
MSQHDITNRSLFSLSWPIFIDLFLHFATLLINTYMVSHVSTAYLAAMGVGNQVFDLCITLFTFISIGCSVVIAQYLGAKNALLAKKAIHTAIAINLLLGLLCAVCTSLFGYKVLQLMNIPEHLMADGFGYLHILGFALVPEAISWILASCLRVYDKTKTAMYVTLIVNVITILGNTIVLYGLWGMPQFGLVGVAWSTLIARIVGVILLACMIHYGLRLRFEPAAFFMWSRAILGNILRIGLPSAGENLLWMLQYMVAFAFIGLLGETPLAAQTLYFQLALFVMLFGIAVSIGNEIMVGHLVGAKNFERAFYNTFRSLKLGIGATIVVVISFWFLRHPILNALSNDQNVIMMLLPLFTLSVFLEPARSVNIIMVNALRAAGDARYPLCTALIFMWGVALPVGYLLGIKLEMGIMGIWIGVMCDEWLRGFANAWRWRSRKWQSKRLAI